MEKIKAIVKDLKECGKEFENSLKLEAFIKDKLKDYKFEVGETIEIDKHCNVPYYIYDLDIFIIVKEDTRDIDIYDPDSYVSFIKDINIYKKL